MVRGLGQHGGPSTTRGLINSAGLSSGPPTFLYPAAKRPPEMEGAEDRTQEKDSGWEERRTTREKAPVDPKKEGKTTMDAVEVQPKTKATAR